MSQDAATLAHGSRCASRSDALDLFGQFLD